MGDVKGYAISIHSPRMGRDLEKATVRITANISIHSPRMGRDFRTGSPVSAYPISIHSPRMGRDASDTLLDDESLQFQSTLPAWGETSRCLRRKGLRGISIHSPRMGRDEHWRRLCPPCWRISIHSPRMGRDSMMGWNGNRSNTFQSTLPAWGETIVLLGVIHLKNPFQSTLPAWGETGDVDIRLIDVLFQSTLPAWGETYNVSQF